YAQGLMDTDQNTTFFRDESAINDRFTIEELPTSDEDSFDEFIDKKKDFLYENETLIEKLKEEELKRMYPEFWDEKSSFHNLRKEFIYKKEHEDSLKRLKEL
ncbi:MAG: hypothetical protein ACPGUI_07690, partial [Halarcobacter sp.]